MNNKTILVIQFIAIISSTGLLTFFSNNIGNIALGQTLPRTGGVILENKTPGKITIKNDTSETIKISLKNSRLDEPSIWILKAGETLEQDIFAGNYNLSAESTKCGNSMASFSLNYGDGYHALYSCITSIPGRRPVLLPTGGGVQHSL